MKNLDWPEAIWEAWLSFEHLHGSVDEVDACLDKIEKAQYQVNARRAKVVYHISLLLIQVCLYYWVPGSGSVPSGNACLATTDLCDSRN